MAYKQFWDFEEQFVGVPSAHVPANRNSLNNTIVEANGDMGIPANQSTAEPIALQTYIPNNHSMQQFTSFAIRNTDLNDITSTINTTVGNVSVPGNRVNHTTSTDVNGGGQNNNINGNHETQEENDMRSSVNTGELDNLLTIDSIESTEAVQVNAINDWLQSGTNNPTFQQLAEFMGENIYPNNVSSTINETFPDVSLLTAPIEQSPVINASETRPNENSSRIANTQIMDETMPPDANGPELSDLDEVNLTNHQVNEPVDGEQTNETTVSDSNDTNGEFLVEEQANSSERNNETTEKTEVTECIDLTYENVEPEGTNNLIVQNEGKQQRKRKISDAMTSDRNSKKIGRTGLRSAMKMIPESASGGTSD